MLQVRAADRGCLLPCNLLGLFLMSRPMDLRTLLPKDADGCVNQDAVLFAGAGVLLLSMLISGVLGLRLGRRQKVHQSSIAAMERAVMTAVQGALLPREASRWDDAPPRSVDAGVRRATEQVGPWATLSSFVLADEESSAAAVEVSVAPGPTASCSV